MRPEDIPRAAIDAALLESHGSADYGPTVQDRTRRVLAAAAPHLVDFAMVTRAARTLAKNVRGGNGVVTPRDRDDANMIICAALGASDDA